MATEMEKVAGKKRQRQISLMELDQEDSEEKLESITDDDTDNTSMKVMKQVERIQVKKSAQLYQLCHTSKSLYNQALYLINTTLEEKGKWVRYKALYENLKDSVHYKALPSQTAQQVLILLDRNWKSYFVAHEDWELNPDKYPDEPQLPKYKPKDGENLIIFTNQQCRIKGGVLRFPKKVNLDAIPVNQGRVSTLNQVRILPRGIYYIVEIVYEKAVEDYHLPTTRVMGIDLGLNNIVAVVNNVGLRPFVVKGGAIKSINQFWNKRRAEFQSMKDQQGLKSETKRLQRLTWKRNNMITDVFHKISRALINYCVVNSIGTLVIGYNALWKQNCNIGKKNNQNFVNIPFQKLIQHLQYKAALIGITVVLVEEMHTSKCSFVDAEPIEHHDQYVGQRGVYNPETKKVMRGLFKTKDGKIINSDINGAYNILRKAFPEAIRVDGIEGLGLVPYSLKLKELNQLNNLNPSVEALLKTAEAADGIEASGSHPVSTANSTQQSLLKFVNIE